MTDNSSVTLQPGEIIKPQMTEQTAIRIVEKLYALQVREIKELNSYDDKNYYVTVEEKHGNPHIKTLCPHGYVLKVLNSMDSKKKHVEAEHEVLHILNNSGYLCPLPALNIHGQDKHLETIHSETETYQNNNKTSDDIPESQYMVRLLTYIPGRIIHEVTYTPNLLYQVGCHLATLNKTLQGYAHEALQKHQTMWNLSSVPQLNKFVYAVRQEDNRVLVDEILLAFSQQVEPLYEQFQKGVIHGDFNEQNIIVRNRAGSVETDDDAQPGKDKYEICGVLDFGDLTDSYLVFDVAITIMYMMVEAPEPLLVGGHVLAGYLSLLELRDVEFDALKVCVAGRFVQSLVMGEYTYMLDPSNDYPLVCNAKGWPRLASLWATPKEELYRQWRNAIDTHKSKS